MPITPAHAQTFGGDGSLITQLFPLALLLVVFYFLLIRPQQKRAKDHRALVESLKRGDVVTTSGGIRGRIVKAVEGSETIDVEIASNTVVEVVRAMVTDARGKDGDPKGRPAAKK